MAGRDHAAAGSMTARTGGSTTSAPTRDGEGRRGGSGLSVPAAIVVALVVIALIVYGTLTAVSLRDHDAIESQAAREAAASSAARTEVVNLISVSTGTSAADIKRLLAGATGSFRDQFASSATSFQQTLKAGNVTSVGAVGQTGVVSLKGNTAVLLVAATATVKNSSAPKGEPRSYRFKLTMTETSGRWLVSDLGFVA